MRQRVLAACVAEQAKAYLRPSGNGSEEPNGRAQDHLNSKSKEEAPGECSRRRQNCPSPIVTSLFSATTSNSLKPCGQSTPWSQPLKTFFKTT